MSVTKRLNNEFASSLEIVQLDEGINVSFVRVDMIGDGACIFRSLAYAIFRDAELHLAMRNVVVDHVVKHWANYKDFITSQHTKTSYTNEAEYRNYMTRANVYGTFIELTAAAELFDVCIKIYFSDRQQKQQTIGNVNDPVVHLKFSGPSDSGHVDVYESPKTLDVHYFTKQDKIICYKYLKYLTRNLNGDDFERLLDANVALARAHELIRGATPLPYNELDIIAKSFTELYNTINDVPTIQLAPDQPRVTLSPRDVSNSRAEYYSLAQLFFDSNILQQGYYEEICNLANKVPIGDVSIETDSSDKLYIYVKFSDLVSNRSMRELFLKIVDFSERTSLPQQIIKLLDDLLNDTTGIIERQDFTVKQALVDLLKKKDDTLPYKLYLFVDRHEYDNIETGVVKSILNEYNDYIEIIFAPVFHEITFTSTPFRNFQDTADVNAVDEERAVIDDDILVNTLSAPAPASNRSSRRRKRKITKLTPTPLMSSDSEAYSSDYTRRSRQKRSHVRLHETADDLMVTSLPPPPSSNQAYYAIPSAAASSPLSFDPTAATVTEAPATQHSLPLASDAFERDRLRQGAQPSSLLRIPAPQSMPAYLIDVITTIPDNADDSYLTCPTNALQDVPHVFNFARSFDRVRQINLAPLNSDVNFFKMLSPLALYAGDELNESQAMWFVAKSNLYFVACADNYEITVQPFREFADRDRVFMFMVKYNFLWHYKNFIKTLPALALTPFANRKVLNAIHMYDRIVQSKYNNLMLTFSATQSTFGVDNKLLKLMINVQ
ncbi:vp80 capsid protein [Orgyia leucostigma nucleopolyhedrovirus]|uniref:Vp80 capsid protein n=1 Tax=Orgyia leucostigma nucleopolyhedrovirus TaxID=490711 RepID=B0FDV9_9ABAC|nr:vp80 capsid protein [Orgyia leucostigma nucleopolyhedrovirus]ABY65817.1 vp80 capsid protein [Orgyia leucostigma nucleopolyhedrovirus]